MDRIAQAFARAREENRACFVAYLCAGDPDFETSLRCCRAVIEAGTDILEIGVPERVLALVTELRKTTDVPIVFYTYYNLVFAHGVRAYVDKAKAAGVDGLLTLDLPPEEADELLGHCREVGLRNVFIVAPTTSDARLAKIAAAASGFLYYVSREGVTGERASLAGNIAEAVARIRGASDLPVVVGFGISTRGQVAEVARAADGVVVGSALVNCIRDRLDDKSSAVSNLRARAADLAAGVRR
jgi:tryptophan synthase alpha chain